MLLFVIGVICHMSRKDTHVGTRRMRTTSEGVGEKVVWPSENLHGEHADEGVQGCFVEYVVVISDVSFRGGWEFVV